MREWPRQIETLRQWVTWECRDIPPDLVLSIINHESGGIVGVASHDTTPPFEVTNDAGQKETANHAYGLMQTTPGLLRTWQDGGKTPKITIDDLRQKDERAARCQILLGCWYFDSCVRSVHSYDPKTFSGSSSGSASNEHLRLALTAYAAGFGAKSPPGGKGLKPKLDKLKELGKPLTLDAIAEVFPEWGRKKDGGYYIRPIAFARNVWGNFQAVRGNAPAAPRPNGTRIAALDPIPVTTSTALVPMTPVGEEKKGWISEYWPLLVIGGLLFLKFSGVLDGRKEEDEEDDGEEYAEA